MTLVIMRDMWIMKKIYNCRYEILRKAYERSRIADDADFQKFCKENKEWLDDYALYTEIKAHE